MLQGPLAEILGGGKYIDHLLGGGKYSGGGGTTNSPRAQKEDSTGFIRLLGKIRAQAGAVMLHHAAARFGVIRGGEVH